MSPDLDGHRAYIDPAKPTVCLFRCVPSFFPGAVEFDPKAVSLTAVKIIKLWGSGQNANDAGGLLGCASDGDRDGELQRNLQSS